MLRRTGFLRVFNDTQIQLCSLSHNDDCNWGWVAESHGGDTVTQPQPKTTVSPGLYETKEVVDESGKSHGDVTTDHAFIPDMSPTITYDVMYIEMQFCSQALANRKVTSIALLMSR